MGHVVLLGDSIFDNAFYVPDDLSVVGHLGQVLPSGWQASLVARDGSLVADVIGQLARVPAEATHLVVSAGGNDSLNHRNLILREPASSFSEVLSQLGEILDVFRQGYRSMLDQVRSLGKPTVVCTIYDSVPGLTRQEQTGLALFNESILREAARAGVPVIDLRLVCSEATDYSAMSPIEPSGSGGAKIARAINRLVTRPDFDSGRCLVTT